MCDFNLVKYPYDIQTCKLKFGSWTHSEKDLLIIQTNNDIDMNFYKTNEEWELLDVNSSINKMKYSCCSDYFFYKMFYFNIKRLSGYYENNILFPAFSLASLNLLTFLIPWDSGERISFSITVLLSVVVFLLLVSDNIPKTEQLPLLSKLISSLIIFSLISVLLTIFMVCFCNYRKVNFEDDKKNIITNKIMKNIYKLFIKLKLISDEDEINKIKNNNMLVRSNSYIKANSYYIILNNNLLIISTYLHYFFTIFLLIFFIGIIIDFNLSIN